MLAVVTLAVLPCYFFFETTGLQYCSTVNPRICYKNLLFLRERLKKVLIPKALTLISRYRGSYLKGALYGFFRALQKIFSPIIFGRVF